MGGVPRDAALKAPPGPQHPKPVDHHRAHVVAQVPVWLPRHAAEEPKYPLSLYARQSLVHPTGQSPNLTPAAKSLIRRHKKGILRWRKKGSGRRITDFRGQNIAALEKRQTSISPALRAELVGRYEAGQRSASWLHGPEHTAREGGRPTSGRWRGRAAPSRADRRAGPDCKRHVFGGPHAGRDRGSAGGRGEHGPSKPAWTGRGAPPARAPSDRVKRWTTTIRGWRRQMEEPLGSRPACASEGRDGGKVGRAGPAR